MRAVPCRVGAGLIDLFLRYQRPRPGNVAWRELVASLPAELDPVLETEEHWSSIGSLTLRYC